MTDIIARAKELAGNGHQPGPWGAFDYDELGERPDGSYGMKSSDGEYIGIMRGPYAQVAAFAPDAIAALAEQTYRYGVEIHMGGRWIMLASPSKGNSLDHAPWFATKKQAESFRDNRTIKAHARIVRRRVSPTEVVE